ncbi:acyl-CoA N-acyltransferase [Xylariales sp. AK1849]|nr:acyl-CoA N-acyltransferase [Xylariales sp. AK1849]
MSASNTSHVPEGIALVPVTSRDLAALVEVQIAAFESDQFSNLMVLGRDKDAHQKHLSKSLELWMSDPASHLVQAVDTAAETVGWSCWVLKREDSEETDSEDSLHRSKSQSDLTPTVGEGKDLGDDDSTRPEGQAEAEQIAPQSETTKTAAQVLGGVMHKDLSRWEDEHLKGKKHVVLQALFTDPGYQGRGIGSKLVQWVVDRADAQGLPCWAHASPAGSSLYARAGFQVLGSNEYDLDEYAPGGKEANGDWGMYTFRYMLRPARNTT